MYKLIQKPATSQHKLYYRGDLICFELLLSEKIRGKAYLRTNLENAAVARKEIIHRVEKNIPHAAQDWRDIPMEKITAKHFKIIICLTEVGHFEAKTCFFPENSEEPVWPEGNNVNINVEPAEYACSNSVYCAFTRQFGQNKNKKNSRNTARNQIKNLDKKGFTVIPPSGTFRDLKKEIDFIFDELNCRILHLLPINPTPTVYARMGRYGSPYASLDFTGIDPSLAEFDKKATPLDQFKELVDAVHLKEGRLFLDIAINHTGWAAKIHEEHSEWLIREEDGTIHSPGAWGVVWGDLTELDHRCLELWKYLAEMFIIWCRRGVDGFRCDAGYMIPFPAWEYIISRVRNEYPDTIFLLEGLGGDPKLTTKLLNKGNMNWAYSELFQNYSREEIESYINYSSKISAEDGLMIHYAETHDNNRLASVSDIYAKMRTALSALLSSNGTFGFTNGVEWFAEEKIDVHHSSALNWGSSVNQVEFISKLNIILGINETFYNNSKIKFIDSGNSRVIAFIRSNMNNDKMIFAVVNLNCEEKETAVFTDNNHQLKNFCKSDLLNSEKIKFTEIQNNSLKLNLYPGQTICLSSSNEDIKNIQNYLKSKSRTQLPDNILLQKAKAALLDMLSAFNHDIKINNESIKKEALKLIENPLQQIEKHLGESGEYPLVIWNWPQDLKRDVMVPPNHFIFVKSSERFRFTIVSEGRNLIHRESIKSENSTFFTLIPPLKTPVENKYVKIEINIFSEQRANLESSGILLLSEPKNCVNMDFPKNIIENSDKLFLAANGRGGISRVCLEWSKLKSRYDALILANLNTDFPEDRHIMLRRYRIWVIYHGRSIELNCKILENFMFNRKGGGSWIFKVPLGDGFYTVLTVSLSMPKEKNSLQMNIIRHGSENHEGKCLKSSKKISLIIRPDIEDRNFHFDTKASRGPEKIWPECIQYNEKNMIFQPDKNRKLRIDSSSGMYYNENEWIYSVFLEKEQHRGLEDHSDLFSPGYFKLDLKGGENNCLTASVLTSDEIGEPDLTDHKIAYTMYADSNDFQEIMLKSMKDFIVRREKLKTVIAGYPWFLDWGRDTLICTRGLISAGFLNDVEKILIQFANFAENGTLPNIIHGNDVGNRDTSDAPLWFFTACRDFCLKSGKYDILKKKVRAGDSLLEVLEDIAENYIAGTPNGIKMDEESAMIFSPPHFTWMDTNFPAGTPRSGYPIEIQALWYAALRFLSEISEKEKWGKLKNKLKKSAIELFYDRKRKFMSDCLHAENNEISASMAKADDHLRSNQLFAVTLGLIDKKEISANILKSSSELLIPGAVRSLADRNVNFKLPVKNGDNLLNNPDKPYWGVYEGDEDSRRKPAYHNGTAWTWPFPSFAEAYLIVYGEAGKKTANSILNSSRELINSGCLGHIPEILDGDSPHRQRGCDAQAWGISELYRVWKLLNSEKL